MSWSVAQHHARALRLEGSCDLCVRVAHMSSRQRWRTNPSWGRTNLGPRLVPLARDHYNLCYYIMTGSKNSCPDWGDHHVGARRDLRAKTHHSKARDAERPVSVWKRGYSIDQCLELFSDSD